jgi:hypothetical protein
MLDSVGKSIIRQGFETLDKALEARLAAKAGQEVEFKAPTEADFAAGVAKDMAKKWMSIPEVRMLVYIVPVGLAILVLSIILSQCAR